MKICGIDPGVSGAVAFLLDKHWAVYDMRIVANALNPAALRDLLHTHAPEKCFLEFATTHPKDGRVGAFRYGALWGGIRAVLACCDVPYELVTPGKWKAFYGLRQTDKEASRAKALMLFPDIAGSLCLKKHHGRAESVPITHYGLQSYHGG
jgi:crossover junction endodeoxyribonuclease RuvC